MMKICKNGVAVIEGDTHFAKWCETEGLIHDKFTARIIDDLTVPGTIAVDGGANIGTLTRVMLDAGAIVHAFEPNPDAMECLRYNCPGAIFHRAGLSDALAEASLKRDANAGASHLDLAAGGGRVAVVPLDSVIDPGASKSISLIKLDVEGFETRALRGARRNIEVWKPALFIEVNRGALERAGSSDRELVELIESMGYKWRIAQAGCVFDDPQFDIIATQ